MVEAISLLTAGAVRERAHKLLALGLQDGLPHFRIDLSKLDAVADLVIAVTQKAYPTGDVPFHSRWRHFVIDGRDRWAAIADKVTWPDAAARARAEFDLAISSVLLDAGAGPAWRYHDATTGKRIGRSEGLALASLDMFARGVFSARAGQAAARRCGQAQARFRSMTSNRAFRSMPTIRWSVSTAAPNCCARLGDAHRMQA